MSNDYPNIVFPITRKRLQNMPEEYNKKCMKKYIDNTIENISMKIIDSASRNIRKLKLMMREIYPLGPIPGCIQKNTYKRENYLPEILNELHSRFPDTKIIMDPMETYIMFDWS